MTRQKRNVTVTLDEATARWARVQAARQDTSLSEYLASLLRSEMEQHSEYEDAMTSWLARGPAHLKQGPGYPAREELHERSGLR
jgi:hypothetical protein